ncbi:MAG: acetyl-CoA carboxylase, carboxyltransferase subunit beta [Planctomycetota bacterium]
MVWSGLKKIGLHKEEKKEESLLCKDCGQQVNKIEFDKIHNVCPHCGYHATISATKRIELLLDAGSFKELFNNLESLDPLEFKAKKGYAERLQEAQEKTGMKDACVIGLGKINNKEVAFGVTDSEFLMGSMGSVVGEKISRITETALEQNLPLIFISGSGGGARMDEGMLSLMQMAKTSASLSRLHLSGNLFISVLTNPSMGGAMASFAALGDFIIAEPKALLGFAGPNVIKQTIRAELPSNFQRSEFMMEKGFIDMIVERSELKNTISRILCYCGTKARNGGSLRDIMKNNSVKSSVR